MIHRIHGKPPVPESKFSKAQREAREAEARVTQPTTDPEFEVPRHVHEWPTLPNPSCGIEGCPGAEAEDWHEHCVRCGGINPFSLYGDDAKARADRPPEPPTPTCPDCGPYAPCPNHDGDRPPEPPTLDVERMARAMDRAVRAKGTRNPPGATAIAREYAALGASPPPPDLSQKVIDAAQVLIDDRGGTTGDHLRDLDDALREYRRFLASQPPSTPREP